jgi:hypothetical protein
MKKLPQFLMDLDEEYRDRLGMEDAQDMELFAAQHVGASCVVKTAAGTPAENGVYLGADGRWHFMRP